MKFVRFNVLTTFCTSCLATGILLLSSCVKENSSAVADANLHFSLRLDQPSVTTSGKQSSTRALAENDVTDLWLYQFDATGKQVAAKFFDAPNLAELTIPANELILGEGMVFFALANVGLDGQFKTDMTLSTILGLHTALLNDQGGMFNQPETAVLMSGQSAPVNIPTSGVVPITLKRLITKVSLTVNNTLASGSYPQLTLSSIQLRRAGCLLRVGAVTPELFDGSSDEKRYPAAKEKNDIEEAQDNYMDCTAQTTNLTGASLNYTYFVGSNVRGTGTASAETGKSALTAPANQGPWCCYVEIIGSVQKDASTLPVNVIYRVWLGGDNTKDFNMYANTHYKVKATITGTNAADVRVEITTDKFDLMPGDTEGDHADDIIGWAPPVVGDYYYTDGSTSSKVLSGKTVNGVIYYVDAANPKKFKVMALIQESNSKSWAVNHLYVIGPGAQSFTDSWGNAAVIKKAFNNKMTSAGVAITESTFEEAFPAAAHCYNYQGKDDSDAKGTWYLPAKNDLQYLFCAYNGSASKVWENDAESPAKDEEARLRWNALLTAPGVDGAIIQKNGVYWSSTEFEAQSTLVLSTSYSSGDTDKTIKTETRFLRCVRDLPITPPAATVGDYYYTDGSFSSKVESGKTVNGLIYYVDVINPRKFKVLALPEGPVLKCTNGANYKIGPGAQSFIDSRSNTAAVITAFNNKRTSANVTITESTFEEAFPAIAFCYNYQGKNNNDIKGTWYLPAKNDLQYLYCAYNGIVPRVWNNSESEAPAKNAAARIRWDALLTAPGVDGDAMKPDANRWSSTEDIDMPNYSYNMYFQDGKEFPMIKTMATAYGRCVRDL